MRQIGHNGYLLVDFFSPVAVVVVVVVVDDDDDLLACFLRRDALEKKSSKI